MSLLREEAAALRARYDEEPSHSDHVTHLALRLFDELHPWHQLGGRERELLQAGALLHDIGWSQSPDGTAHHKASARLIEQHPWQQLQAGEIPLVAQIARYHRKSIPQPGHPAFHALPKVAQKKVRVLAGLLRVADALDRTHSAVIPDLTARVEEEALTLTVAPVRSWAAEQAMVAEKKDLLELAAERPVRCLARAQ